MRRRRGWMFITAVLLAMAAAAVVTVQAWPGPAPLQGTPAFPERFSTSWDFTSSVQARPAGRAIAMYDFAYDKDGWYQQAEATVVGADRDSYRTIPDPAGYSMLAQDRFLLLAPDGTHVLSSEANGDFALIDLSTGTRRVIPRQIEAPGSGPAGLLAWSPDGRYVAYGGLGLLDLQTGTSTFPRLRGDGAVAFSPDSRHIAVVCTDSAGVCQPDNVSTTTRPVIHVYGLDGAPDAAWTARTAPAPGTDALAWSPDGSLLAIATHTATDGRGCSTVVFVPMVDGISTPSPIGPCAQLLGWRGSTSVVVERDTPDGAEIDVVSTVDGKATVLNRTSLDRGCSWTGMLPCRRLRLQVATNLLAEAGTRPSHADFGPWYALVHTGGVTIAVLFVGAVAVLVVRRVRHPRPPRPPERPRRNTRTDELVSAVPLTIRAVSR